MGILDEAIREHLELKRQHGAEESELEGLESSAFGPADRPDAIEAETQVISPGSSITAPAGEGDQLDKVFEATRQADASSEHNEAEAAADATGEATIESPVAEEVADTDPESMPAASTAEVAPPEADAPAAPVVASPPVDAPDTGEPAEVKASQPPEAIEYDDHDGDAGDALQRERAHLSDHPTEHYDVDAAIAEENEIDVLSESSLSDELDRALDGPLEPEPAAAAPPAAPAEPDAPAEPVADEDPISDEFEHVFDDEPESESEPELEVEEETAPDAEDVAVDGEAEVDPEGDVDFFDQDDPLEATPDFLEETPEHDRLWFEQKPPKDFEFGD